MNATVPMGIDPTHLTCAMFPDPRTETEWMQKGNNFLNHVADLLESRGVNCIRTPARPSWRWLCKSRKKVDIIHLHWPEAFYRLRGLLVPGLDLLWVLSFVAQTRYYRIPYVWTVHDLYPHGTTPKNACPTERVARRFLFKNAHTAIVNCSSATPLVRQEFGEHHRCVVAPLGSYRRFYPDRFTDVQARKTLGLSTEDFVFLVFGGQRKHRNAIEVIDAFCALEEKNVRLVVAGMSDRGVRAKLEAAGSKDPRIMMRLGFVPAEEIELYLKSCDFVVVPGHWYLTSAVVLLGLSYCRPVIVPSWGCSKEMIGNAGYVYDETQPEDLLSCMRMALSSDREHLQFLANQQSGRLSWENHTSQLIAAYT